MNEREALKLALGIARSMFAADDAYGCGYYNDPSWRAAYRELRKITQEALAHAPTEQEQPAQQEPVACVGTNGELMWLNKSKVIYSKPIPLYTTPPSNSVNSIKSSNTLDAQRKPLSDVEIWNTYKNLWMFHPAEEPRLAGDVLKFARAIEQAHGIKE